MKATTSSPEIPNRLNLAIIVVQLLAIAACIGALSRINSGWSLALLAVVFGIVMNSVYSIIHEAEHAMLFSNRRWNDIAGSLLALFFPAPFHLIRQSHLGHHLRNRSDDEAFDFYFEEDHKLWRFLAFYGILTGLFYVVVVLSNVVFLLMPFREDKKIGDQPRSSRGKISETEFILDHSVAMDWGFHIDADPLPSNVSSSSPCVRRRNARLRYVSPGRRPAS